MNRNINLIITHVNITSKRKEYQPSVKLMFLFISSTRYNWFLCWKYTVYIYYSMNMIVFFCEFIYCKFYSYNRLYLFLVLNFCFIYTSLFYRAFKCKKAKIVYNFGTPSLRTTASIVCKTKSYSSLSFCFRDCYRETKVTYCSLGVDHTKKSNV